VAALALALSVLALAPAARAADKPPTAAGSPASGAARQLAQPTKDALSLAALVRARELGVDHLGNLWGWNGVEGSMRFFSPTAERLGTILIPKSAMAAAGDSEWGAVALDGEGSRLVWVRPGENKEAEAAATPPPAAAAAPDGTAPAAAAAGPAGNAIDLPEIAAWVCWIDADTVAIAPQLADHRVELWNLRNRKLVKSFGKEQKIVLKSGANRVREVQLRYDAVRRLLYTLETFSGELAVFKIDGTLVWHAVLDNPWRQVEEAKLAALDSKAKLHDSAYPQFFSDLWLGEGPDGSAWVRQSVEPEKQTVHLAKVTASGSTPKTMEKVGCPAKSFTIWGDNLIFFRDIASPRAVCNSVAPLP
jgi:hypothetical protein